MLENNNRNNGSKSVLTPVIGKERIRSSPWHPTLEVELFPKPRRLKGLRLPSPLGVPEERVPWSCRIIPLCWNLG